MEPMEVCLTNKLAMLTLEVGVLGHLITLKDLKFLCAIC